MSSFLNHYNSEIKDQLMSEFGYKNIFEIPKVDKISVNIGVGRINDSKELMEQAKKSLARITGQIPGFNKAKKSISGFKLREGQIVGFSTTLRGKRMYDFLERLITISLPRIRDFRGISSKSFDKQGNLSIGISEIGIFPEINFENQKENISLEVNINILAKNQAEARHLLELFGVPFTKESTKE
ncbi:MAG: large subunit ribosomal protein L5 [Candidatus Berkelbacteria bacterium Athens1014_28]|uniref:Large ribosomal subunit protein uL5 n=1 Tax=Candidatus Berkelbacteria bacterium Athens1014_28 TaxID=2017145 RepID=A0A554LQY0_9BACT|nr:MAG: large subunit ribosomal protein L5 [Candidatus Berkelbacteria bacterium Athens1014_28]